MAPEAHPFESAGLGRAPFALGPINKRKHCDGTCALCGTSIRYEYFVYDADCKRFTLGCECVKQSDRSLYEEFRRRQREQKRAAQAVRKYGLSEPAVFNTPSPREEKELDAEYDRITKRIWRDHCMDHNGERFVSFADLGNALLFAPK